MTRKIINGVILAAGLSSRMGDFKPLMPLKGKTLIENTIESMLCSGVQHIVIVVGFRADEVTALLRQKYSEKLLTIARNDHYSETDMLCSVKIALCALPKCDGFFLLPGDMPVVAKATFLKVKKVWETSDAALAFPTLSGRRKHPPLVSYRCIKNILSYSGDDGLRAVWQAFEQDIVTVPVDDIGCQTDLDTPEDYHNCLKYIKQRSILNVI